MKIEFVNHSSFIVRSKNVSLLCDFWKEGTAFNNGWNLLCTTQLDYSDFSNITHLWFSHEHPDHFYPQNLWQIPEEFRNNITILFQKTLDKRVISLCRKMGFADVIELERKQLYQLDDDFEVLCEPFGSPWGEVDSWILIKASGTVLLNLNDCEIDEKESILELKAMLNDYVDHIDLLATQFSYAAKQGNDDDFSWIKRAQKYNLDKVALQAEILAPKFLLPFASFVYFCHQENHYLNKGIIKVSQVVERIKSITNPIVMYPDDKWTVGSSWDNASSIERYEERYKAVAGMQASDLEKSTSVEPGELVEAANTFLEEMFEMANKKQIAQVLALSHASTKPKWKWSKLTRRMAALIAGFSGNYESGRIYVTDHYQAYELTLDGLKVVNWNPAQCHISLSAESLLFCFKQAFGGETLQVNGRFYNNYPGWRLLSEFFFLARSLEQGLKLPKSPVIESVLKMVNKNRKPMRSVIVQGQ